MIDQVYTTLQSIVNKENSGYVSPEEFNQIAKQVQDKIFRGYFEDYNKDKNRENRGLTNPGVGNLAMNQDQRIAPFRRSASVNKNVDRYLLPSDVYYVIQNGVINDSNRVIEPSPDDSHYYLALSEFGPSDLYPMYTRSTNEIFVHPNTYAAPIYVRYIKHPEDPKWTYTVINGQELYDPSKSDFQDFELQEIEFSTIVIEMLTYFGINLREGDVVQIAEALKNKQEVKDSN
ncbi:MAG: hypothetical protein HKN45_11355 [Flavobacteriales bacterium]|nr:hypothetical protein [Flavobacteriales bacterium]